MNVQPYLFFDGRCEEAHGFLQEGGRRQGRDADALEGLPATRMRLHAAATRTRSCTPASRSATRGCWCPTATAKGKPEFKGFSLTITAKTEAEADKFFDALSAGGQVRMPHDQDILLAEASACAPTSSASAGWSWSTTSERAERRDER